MKKTLSIVLTIMMILSSFASLTFTTSAAGAYFNAEVTSPGWEIYSPHNSTGYGYRYGPTMIINDDGSFDAWFSCTGCSGLNVLDYISYKHSEDGVNWSDEKIVLDPTPHSPDRLSCCDPGIIKFGGYYYLGYTSTLDARGYDNSVFVARSENPDGPYEKWNGSGWGGFPQPLVCFEGHGDQWGIGEVAFVEVDGVLYIYYTQRCETGNFTMVSLADATDPNWPATRTAPTVAITMGTSQSGTDVKYDDATGKFFAVAAVNGFTENSYMSVFTSQDGLTFQETDRLYKNVYYYAANQGITGSPNGHFKVGQQNYIAYAHGEKWGNWATRMAPISITTSNSLSLNDDSTANLIKSGHGIDTNIVNPIGITPSKLYHVKNVGDSVALTFQKFSTTMARTTITDTENITFSAYNSNIVSFNGTTCTAKGVGRTTVRAEYNGLYTTFVVDVRAAGENITSTAVKEWRPFLDTVYINMNYAKYHPQMKGIAMTYAGQIGEALNQAAASGIVFDKSNYVVTYSGYNGSVVYVRPEDGYCIPTGVGTTNVTVTINGTYSFTVKVEVYSSANPISVSLDANGGTCSKSSLSLYYGYKYGPLPTPVRSGYNFTGWYDQNNKLITSQTAFDQSSNCKLHATWEKIVVDTSYTVTFDANGGTLSGSSTATVKNGATVASIPTATKEDYTFVGWYNAQNNVYLTANTAYNFGCDLTFVAQWRSAIEDESPYTGIVHENIKKPSSSPYGIQNINVVTVDPTQSDIKINVVNGGSYGNNLVTVKNTIKRFAAAHPELTPVVAVNGDLWTMASAHARVQGSGTTYGGCSDAVVKKSLTLPRGFSVYQGEIVCSPHMYQETPYEGNFWAFGVTAENEMTIGCPTLSINVSTPTKSFTADGMNRLPANDALVLYTDKGCLSNYALDDAYEIVVEFGKDYTVKHGSSFTGVVTGIYSSAVSSNPTITATSMILTARGTALSRLAGINVGDALTVSFSVGERFGRDVAIWQKVTDSVGGHMPFVIDGVKNITGTTTGYPVTMIGICNDGTLKIIANDGRQSGFSRGFDFKDYALVADEFDINTGMIVDGGGSTTMVLLDENEYKVVNSPSDGSERAVVNSLIISKCEPHTTKKTKITTPCEQTDPADLDFTLPFTKTMVPGYSQLYPTKVSNGLKLTVKDYNGDAYGVISFNMPNTSTLVSNPNSAASQEYDSISASDYNYMLIDMNCRSSDPSTILFQSLYLQTGRVNGATSNTFVGFNNVYNDTLFHTYCIDISKFTDKINTLRLGMVSANGVNIYEGDSITIRSIRFAKTQAEANAMIAEGYKHSYSKSVVGATCTSGGYTRYTCTHCGNVYYTDKTDVKGHNYVATVTQPTCTTPGGTKYTCSTCGASYTEGNIPATGHSYVASVTQPTCTAGGYTKYICSVCGDSYTSDTTAALGHSYGEWVTTKEATATENGEKRRECVRCDAYETAVIPATGEPDEGENRVYVENYDLIFTNVTGIIYIRVAPGDLKTASEIKNAPGCVTINASEIAKRTDATGKFAYELSTGGIYSVWYKYSDNTEEIVSGINATEMTPEVEMNGAIFKLKNLYGIADFFLAKGTYNTYREVKNHYFLGITNARFGTKHNYTYGETLPGAGDYTVWIRFTDSKRNAMCIHFTVDVAEPEITVNGNNIIVTEVEGVKAIRVAPGTFAKYGEVKKATGCITYSAADVKRLTTADGVAVISRNAGSYTLAVQYENGYTAIRNVTVE